MSDKQVREICSELIRLIDLKNIDLSDALRTVFNQFSHPKETQQFERILETIS